MSKTIGMYVWLIVGYLAGSFVTFVLTLDEPKRDSEFECPEVILVSEKPFNWHQLDSQIWWNEGTPVGFSPYGSSYICLFEEA